METKGEYSYAGIGSRKTPSNIIGLIQKVAAYLREKRWALRSGGAKGADLAFETGARKGEGLNDYKYKTIYLPTKDYVIELVPLVREITKKHAPHYDNVAPYIRALLYRNTQIIMGKNGDNPVRFVVCWTPNSETVGGTGMGIRIAKTYDIPIFNLGDPNTLKRVCDKVGYVML